MEQPKVLKIRILFQSQARVQFVLEKNGVLTAKNRQTKMQKSLGKVQSREEQKSVLQKAICKRTKRLRNNIAG